MTPFVRENCAALQIVPQRLEYLDRWLRDLYEKGQICQLVVKLMRRGEVFYEGIYGDDGQGGILSADTIFPVSSITKPVVSALAHMLQEDGLLDVCDPVHHFLPFSGGNREHILIAHLLTHISGIIDPYLHEDGAAYLKNELGIEISGEDDAFDAALLLAREKLGLPPMDDAAQAVGDTWTYIACNKLSSRHKPDEIMAYCSFGYDLLKRIVDSLTGEPTDDFARRRLFGPLGMKDTAWLLPREKWPRVIRRGEGTEGYPYLNSERCFVGTSGGGGLKTTANDILRFAEMIRCDGTLGGVSVFAPATVRRMVANHNSDRPNVYDSWALGFNYRAEKFDDTGSIRPPVTLDHSGWGGTKFVIDRENSLTAAIFNVNVTGIPFPDGIFGRIMNIVYSALDE